MMRSILDRSRFANTHISPTRMLRKHFSSNLTSINHLDKVMRSCSVNAANLGAETKLYDFKNNFEEIDEALHSESKGTSNKNYMEDREQSNTSLERDILDISAIMDKNKLTKKKILENISFDTTQHDIYNPEFSSCDFSQLGKEEIIIESKDELTAPQIFLDDYDVSLNTKSSKKMVSPIRIKKKFKIKSRLETEFDTPQQSLLSRNLSQNTCNRDNSLVKQRKRKQQSSKLLVSSKKRKKIVFTKKRKQVYDYYSKKSPVESANTNNGSVPRKIYFDNYYIKHEPDFNTEQLILATSTKYRLATLEPQNYDTSTVETGRVKSSYSKAETNCRSA